MEVRKMASVQLVRNVEPIPNADSLEKLKVLEWAVVAKKGEFHVGDMCVYVEIDAEVPQHPEFEFLRPRKFRVKTIRLRGQLSQGLALPLANPYVKAKFDANGVTPIPGLNVSELLDIKKYEPPIPAQLMGTIKGAFPGFIPKTDELRIQSFPGVIDELRGKTVYIATKVDGTSFTAYHRDGEYGVCSRNLEMKPGDNSAYSQAARQYHVEEKLRNAGNYAIQAEMCGPGIQDNPLGLPEVRLMVFNVFDIDHHAYLDYDQFVNFCQMHGFQTVPIDAVRTFDYATVDEVLEAAKGRYLNGRTREGIVIRPVVEQHSNTLGGRLSIKAINNDYL